MAAASPALSNNSADTSSVAASIGGNLVNNISGGSNSSKNQRGLNKPKCIKCGNVARSRCPYQSCKSCCAKAQNPCHIHVLKGTSSLPDKVPSSGSPSVDQQSTEVSSSGSSFRVASLRQLSNNFAQFNNLQSPLRSRKPLTRKEAVVINEWRFLKLKEYRDRNIEAENDAFDRYMQNVSLLEEVFAASSTLEEPKKHESPLSNPASSTLEEPKKHESPLSNPASSTLEEPKKQESSLPNPSPNSEQNDETVSNPDPNSEQNDETVPNPDPNSEENHETITHPDPNSEQNDESIPNPAPNSEQNDESIPIPDPNSELNHELISRLKLKLRSDPDRTENSRKRVRYIVDQGLKKLKKLDTTNVVYDLGDEAELIKRPKKAELSRVERVAVLRDLTDKLSKARNAEDLKSCREIKARLFDTHKKANGVSGDMDTLEQKDDTKEDSHKRQSGHSPPKWFSTVTIDQDAVNRIDAHFSSLEEIEDL